MEMRSRSWRLRRSRPSARKARAIPTLSRAPRQRHARERAGEMQRRRQRAAAQRGDASARLHEIELAVPADFVGHAQPLVEIEQIDAAAQQHVLAVVDHLGILIGGRDRKGGGASAQKGPRLRQFDAKSRAAQGRRGGQAGQAAAQYEYGRHKCAQI